ncbi:MAG: hypothetical protein H6740_19640 [Alphaproteobacteria bacterium]|nr:hypothetical protein [Alphaproteobacteria bacterium]
MIPLLLTPLALAEPGGASLTGTAHTLEPGAWVLRQPFGPSAVGLTPRLELQLTPFDLALGGPRVGLEIGALERGAWAVSLTPSVGEKGSLGRTALRVELVTSTRWGAHGVSLSLRPELSALTQTRLDEGGASLHLDADRWLLPVTLTWDVQLSDDSALRASARAWALDEGTVFSYGLTTASWLHQWGRLHSELGVGALVGRPSEHVFLGDYTHRLVVAYPKLDLWVLL